MVSNYRDAAIPRLPERLRLGDCFASLAMFDSQGTGTHTGTNLRRSHYTIIIWANRSAFSGPAKIRTSSSANSMAVPAPRLVTMEPSTTTLSSR